MSTHDKKKISLIEQYKNAIKDYSSENIKLLSATKDARLSLELNRQILSDILKKNFPQEKKMNELFNKSKIILNNTEKILDKNKKIKNEIYKLQYHTENIPKIIKKDVNLIYQKNTKNKNEIHQQDIKINKLKSELISIRKASLFKEASTEVFLSGPSKNNLDKNDELIESKSILNKSKKLHNLKEKKFESLKKEYEELKIKFTEIRKLILNNIKDDYFLKQLDGYKSIDDDELDESEENEKHETEQKFDDNNETNKKKILKKYQNEFETLQNKYNQIQKQIFEDKKKCKRYIGKINKKKEMFYKSKFFFV